MNEIKKQGQEDTVGRGEDSDGAALQDRDQGPVQQREQETGRQALPSRRSPREYCLKDYSSTARGLCMQSQHPEGRDGRMESLRPHGIP